MLNARMASLNMRSSENICTPAPETSPTIAWASSTTSRMVAVMLFLPVFDYNLDFLDLFDSGSVGFCDRHTRSSCGIFCNYRSCFCLISFDRSNIDFLINLVQLPPSGYSIYCC